MRSFDPSRIALLATALVLACATDARPDDSPAEQLQKVVAEFVKRHCFDCHTGDKAEAGLQFERLVKAGSITDHRKDWQRALKMLRAGAMPPPEDAEIPPKAEVERVTALLEAELSKVDCRIRDPGRVTIRRLNRPEYNNTIRDLVGVDFKPAKDFPADDVGYGFDNIGDVLSTPTILMEKYLAAAEQIVEKAIVTEDVNEPRTVQFASDRTQGGSERDGWRSLPSVGDVWIEHTFPADADYLLRAEAYGEQAGDEPTKMDFLIDGQKVGQAVVEARRRRPGEYEVKTRVKAGKRRFAVRFINDFYNPKDRNPRNRDRNLMVGFLELRGPLGLKPAKLPETHTRIISCTPNEQRSPESCAKEILKAFARRAWRRPVSNDEINRLAAIFKMSQAQGDSFEQSIQVALQAVLVSPHFLFRVELDPEPNDPSAIRTINEHELATRLSYFLWSSMPDDELFRLADQGQLRKRLDSQVKRMLADPKSQALVVNFAGQWLQLRNLYTVSPDPKRFPAWNARLRDAMRKETEMFFAAVMREDRSILDFIDAKFSFLNETLARHYGVPGVEGDEFRRVSLEGGQRGGVLSQASVLTITSDPTRTSPVKRGKWILEQILGAAPPPPPPNVPELKDDGQELQGTLRQRMEQHRKNPNCAVCHQQMDSLGFGFENYDAIGKWREKDGQQRIDASGVLPGGKRFDGPAELKAILRSNDEAFRRCMVEKMLTYALGRGLEYYDKCAVDDICRSLAGDGDRFVTMMLAIVHSDPFQKRRGKGADK